MFYISFFCIDIHFEVAMDVPTKRGKHVVWTKGKLTFSTSDSKKSIPAHAHKGINVHINASSSIVTGSLAQACLGTKILKKHKM